MNPRGPAGPGCAAGGLMIRDGCGTYARAFPTTGCLDLGYRGEFEHELAELFDAIDRHGVVNASADAAY